MWALLAIYIGFRTIVTPLFHVLYPGPILYAGMGCLIFGNFLYVYAYLVACAQRRHYELMIFALMVPLYWAMMSVAALRALFQFVCVPFYWEKTQHGLHLRKAAIRLRDSAAEVPQFGASLGLVAQNGIDVIMPIESPTYGDTLILPIISSSHT